MKFRPLFLALTALLTLASLSAAEETETRKAIKLEQYTFGGDRSKLTVIRTGKLVTFEVNAYIGEFFKEPIINANARIENTTKEDMHATYVITFYDSDDKVVGAHAANWSLPPEKSINYGSALIRGKVEDFRRVTKYRLYTCVNPEPPKKKRLGADNAKKSEKQDEKKILGTWTVVSVEEEGKKQDLPKNSKAVITRDKITLTADGKTLNEITYKLDASRTPKWIDITVRGEKQAGIFELKGDDLKICSNENTKGKRPTRFESKPDSEHFLLVFKRAKP